MKFEDLKFIRVTDPDIFRLVVPRRLFEQVKDSTFNIDRIYQLADNFIKSPCTHFFVLADEDNVVKGVLWAYVNVFNETVQVNLFSVDKEYQFNNALELTLKFIRSWADNLKITCLTTRPKAYEKAGWQHGKQIMMEIL